jgi:hypothetical protein
MNNGAKGNACGERPPEGVVASERLAYLHHRSREFVDIFARLGPIVRDVVEVVCDKR